MQGMDKLGPPRNLAAARCITHRYFTGRLFLLGQKPTIIHKTKKQMELHVGRDEVEAGPEDRDDSDCHMQNTSHVHAK